MNRLARYYWFRKLKGSPYQWLFTEPQDQTLVSLDCETTSLDPKQADLVSIAATQVVENRIITSAPFDIRLRPPKSLDANSVVIHKIRHQDLANGLTEQEALIALIKFIGNRPLIGYHIRYDKEILDLACKRSLGFPLPNRIIEVSQIYHDLLEKHLPNAYFDLSLDAICRHLNLPIHDKHDALQDAITAAMVYVRLTHGDLPNLQRS